MSTPTSSFAVFILTHGRPDRVITYTSLRRHGYTGPIYLLVDTEDRTLPAYRERYGIEVIVFDKQAVARVTDEGDNFQDRRAVIYARNASWDIARTLGLDYFLQLDDDYSDFRYKYDATGRYSHQLVVKNLDRMFATILAFYQRIPALTVALAQGGDLLGGAASRDARWIWMKRKAMNSFFCATDRPFTFFGRINEDVNTYVTLGGRGELFLTLYNAAIEQESTQHSSGGMTEMYLNEGTYRKSFYTVMYAPSCTRIRLMGRTHMRLHHAISWDHAVPCILSEEWRLASRSPRVEESRLAVGRRSAA